MNPKLLSQDDYLDEDFLREASDRILNGRRDEILARLKQKNNFGPPRKSKLRKRLGWALLTAAAAAAALLYNLNCDPDVPSTREAMSLMACLDQVDGPAELFKPGVKRGSENIEPATQREERVLIIASKAYQGEKYAEALVLYEELSFINPNNSEYLICAGHALYHLKEYELSAEKLMDGIKRSTQNGEGDKLYAANFLLALVYLKTDCADEGREILLSLQPKGGPYKAEVDKLLDVL